MTRVTRGESLDDESRAIIYEGANLSQIGVIFGMDHRDIVRKIHGVKPIGKRGQAQIYAIKDVAPFLVKPGYDIERYIRTMHHHDLPKMLTKEFWAGMRAKQEYQIREGDLWPTSKVVENVGELLKIIKMQCRLSSDAVERQTELSDRQRQIIVGIMDGMLHSLNLAITKRFSRKPAKPAAEGENDDEL